MMWYSFGLKLAACPNEGLTILLHPQNGFLPHVRDLFVENAAGAEDRTRQLLSALPRDTTYGVDDMKAILKACQKLKYLALNLPEVHLGPIMDLADTFRLGSD
jgi:hypothetical protein